MTIIGRFVDSRTPYVVATPLPCAKRRSYSPSAPPLPLLGYVLHAVISTREQMAEPNPKALASAH